MKRIVVYCIILVAALAIPLERLDVGDLEPVQAVWAHKENGKIILETDTKDRGEGRTAEEALENMKTRCPGIIYLDTAEFLLVSEEMTEALEELEAHLKDSVEVSVWDGEGDIVDAARYMSAHKNGKEIRKIGKTDKLPKTEVGKEELKGKNNDLTK